MQPKQVPSSDLDDVLAHAAADLRALQGARLFISGGTGYIGRWLLEALLHANRALSLNLAITVLSRTPEAFRAACPHLAEGVTLHAGDVRDFAFPAGDFTHAIHAATDVIATNSPLETFDVTVQGTRRMLEFCTARGVQRVLLLSSGAVYGRIPLSMERVPETYGGAPATDQVNAAYGIGKIATEWLGTAYAQGSSMTCSSARVFAQVGPYLALDKQFAAGNFMRDALQGQPMLIQGDGTPLRSYMYGSDLCVWLLAILLRGKHARAYNVGSDHSISIRDLALAIAQQAGVTPQLDIRGTPVPGTPPERYVPDIARARDELGLKITVPLETALCRTLDWYRQDVA